MSTSYKLTKYFFKLICNGFFQEIKVVGEKNIPKEGPFVIYSIHRNQFVDALMLSVTNTRIIHFLVAAKSYKKPIIGDLAKLTGGIPVERAIDLAFKGKGKIEQITENVLTGIETKFTEQINLKNGSKIFLSDTRLEYDIEAIISDTELLIKNSELITNNNANSISCYYYEDYKILNKPNYEQMYNEVYKAFERGEGLGIFPEGGSHDQPDFLPLKPGIAIMVIGGTLKTKQRIQLIPCGLNYFEGSSLRGKVIVEYGAPFYLEDELINLYTVNKREAIGQCMDIIRERVSEITMTAQTFENLSAIYLIKELYQDEHELKPNEEIILNRRFQQS